MMVVYTAMTRTCLDSAIPLSLLSTLLASMLGGCVGPASSHQHPVPPSAPPAEDPGEPAQEPPQEPPGAARCAIDAAELYVVVTAPVKAPDQPDRTLRILDGGAWILTEQGQTRTGCLDDGQLAQLDAALAQADFQPPPEPQIRCKALPTTRVTVVDYAHGRKTSYSRPCGEPASDSIHELVSMTEAWFEPVAEAPAPAPAPEPQLCTPGGTPFYRETIWSVPEHNQKGAPYAEIIVYPNGAWNYRNQANPRSGCLPEHEVRALQAQVQATTVRARAVTGPQCAALPTTHTEIKARGTTIGWDGPCGAAVPDNSVLTLQQAIHRALAL